MSKMEILWSLAIASVLITAWFILRSILLLLYIKKFRQKQKLHPHPENPIHFKYFSNEQWGRIYK